MKKSPKVCDIDKNSVPLSTSVCAPYPFPLRPVPITFPFPFPFPCPWYRQDCHHVTVITYINHQQNIPNAPKRPSPPKETPGQSQKNQ